MDKWLRNNTVVKIVAFSLALMLWLMLNLEDQAAPGQPVNDMKSLTIERVKVNIRYDESVYTIVEEPAPVTIELEGKRSLLNQLSLKPDTYEVFVDVTGLNSGRHQVPVQIAGFPDGINVTVNPTDVELVVQKKTTVNKEVHVDLVGQPKEGYVAGEPGRHSFPCGGDAAPGTGGKHLGRESGVGYKRNGSADRGRAGCASVRSGGENYSVGSGAVFRHGDRSDPSTFQKCSRTI